MGDEEQEDGGWAVSGAGTHQYLPCFTLQLPAAGPTQEEPEDLGKEEREFLRS